MDIGLLSKFPLGLGAVILFAVLISSLECGYRLGLRNKKCQDDEAKPESSDFVIGSMFALLGLVMAFTYAFTVSRADMRQQAIVNEANAISTAFLRAELASEPGRSELRKLLLNYARTRVFNTETVKSPQAFNKTISRSLEAQSRLWPATVRMVQSSDAGPKEIAIVQAINEVLDMYVLRLRGTYDRLPGIALLMLISIAAASLAISGFNAGLSGALNRWSNITFTAVLAAVLLIIIDFDVPQRGFIGVYQGALEDVIEEMAVSISDDTSSIQQRTSD